jgi:hypothetical protein
MIGCIWGAAALLVLAGALFLLQASFRTLVFASYPGTFEFTGTRRFWDTHYVALKWVRDQNDPGPCPVVIHTDLGDIGSSEFAEPDRLLARGWVVVPYPPIPPEAAALIRDAGGEERPPVLKYGWGDLRVCPQFTDGALVSVSVWVSDPAHEAMATRAQAARYPISVGGRQIRLPLSQAELFQALGPPEGQRVHY